MAKALGGYQFTKTQLIRMGEIFRPFFDELEVSLYSHLVYRVSIMRDYSPDSGSYVRMYFTLSDEEGVQKDAWAIFNETKKTLEWSSNKLKFDKSRSAKLKKAFIDVIEGIDTIDIDMDVVLVEAGSKWVFGMVVQDETNAEFKNRKEKDDYILFLKSNLYFEDYALKKDGNSVQIDDILEDI